MYNGNELIMSCNRTNINIGVKTLKTKFDELGRIQLTSDIAKTFNIVLKQNLQIRLESMQLVLTPTNEQKLPLQNGNEIRERVDNEQQIPVNQRTYIRAVDENNRIVVPIAFRRELGWTKDTVLILEHKEKIIYLYEYK